MEPWRSGVERGGWAGVGRMGVEIPTVPVPRDQGSSAQPKPWQRFTLMRDFFTAIAGVNQAGQGEMAATHAMPLLQRGGGGGGEASDRARRGKQTKLSGSPFMCTDPGEICSALVIFLLNTLISSGDWVQIAAITHCPILKGCPGLFL